MKRLTYRYIPFFVAILLMAVVPVSAQNLIPPYIQPTATPVPPISNAIVRDVTEATQTLGILTVVILVVLAVMVGVVVFFVIAALRLGLPLVNTVTKLISSRDELQKSADEQERRADEYRAKTAQSMQLAAEAQERTVAALTNLETKTEATQGRANAVTSLQAHFDESVKPIREAADKALNTISDVEKRLDTLATKLDLQAEIGPLRESIEGLRLTIERQLVHAPPAGPLPAAKEGDAP